jgi:hypothetical protein
MFCNRPSQAPSLAAKAFRQPQILPRTEDRLRAIATSSTGARHWLPARSTPHQVVSVGGS